MFLSDHEISIYFFYQYYVGKINMFHTRRSLQFNRDDSVSTKILTHNQCCDNLGKEFYKSIYQNYLT